MHSCAVLVLLLLQAVTLTAQTDGTYGGFSPYSVFGVGNLHPAGTAWNRSMGGVGIAARSHRYVNILNPAAGTARDSLSFMSDFGMNGRMSYFIEGDKKALNTILNIDDFVISFPLWRHTAMTVGLTPVSDVGYGIRYAEADYTGSRNFATVGNGGLYQVSAAFSATLWRRLSLGAQLNYCFGNINKSASITNSDSSYRDMSSGDSLQVNNVNVKFGLQYEQPVSNNACLTLGATYRLSTPMTGYTIHYLELGSYDRRREADILGGKGLRMGDELGVGLSFRKAEDFLVEADYVRTDWTRSRLDQVSGFSNEGDAVFAPSVGQTFRAGVEFTPNRNDIRYYMKTVTYRVGAYFDQSYYTVDGARVNTVALTLGMTFPIFRRYNGVTVGLELGRRGLAANQVKENYFGFNVGFNVFDIWFQKRPYQ